MLTSEELGITQATLDEMKHSGSSEIKRVFSAEARTKIGTDLSLTNNQVVNNVKSMSNYVNCSNAMSARSVSQSSQLNISYSINTL